MFPQDCDIYPTLFFDSRQNVLGLDEKYILASFYAGEKHELNLEYQILAKARCVYRSIVHMASHSKSLPIVLWWIFFEKYSQS